VAIAAVTLIWPVNIPLVALAVKVRQGRKPIDMEAYELWWRCTFAALGLAVLTLILVGLNYLLVQSAEMPVGPVHLVLLLAYLPAAIGYTYWIMGLDDLLEAAGIFALYILLPGLPLLLAGRLAHWWEALTQLAPWLLSPT
jgi:hypothetical protein